MAADGNHFGCEDKGVEEDLYAVLGLTKDCSDGELRTAYKKLALRWHPDRCSAKESKAKFQSIQNAYSVLSDSNKRYLYDFGVYDDDDDGDGQYSMCDFLGEMAAMMQQNKPKDNAEPSFAELQTLFFDMFDGGNNAGAGDTSFGDVGGGDDEIFDAVVDDPVDEADILFGFSSSSSYPSSPHFAAGSKRGATACDPVAAEVTAGFSDLFDSVAHNFFSAQPSVGDAGVCCTTATAGPGAGEACRWAERRGGRAQKVSFDQDVSSGAAEPVSAASY